MGLAVVLEAETEMLVTSYLDKHAIEHIMLHKIIIE